ncbi:opsin, ultraviolet-sensitive-like isoform X1 [Danaus plexippus]|nr:opsin, ultraviolet-sensitive-like isoform X1 [Danaus plexippus]
MSKVTKIVVIIFMIELKCECDTLTGKKQGLILNESDVKESVNQIVNLDYIKYRRQGLWRCYNLMMWKKRKRISGVYNKLKRIISSRIKRSQYFFGNSHSLYENTTSAEEDDSVVTVSTFKKLWPIDDWYRFGLFTDGFISYIDSHWLQFPPPKPSLHYTLAVLYIMLALIGLLGNSIVLLMYYRCRTLRTPGNILVANLALSDFLMLAKTPIFIFNSFHLGPALGKTGCVIYGFAGGLSGTTSIATLTAIALDRYWAVVHPLEPLRALTAIRARLLAVGAWLYAGIFATIPALDIGYGNYVPEGFLTSCSFDYLTEELPPRYFIFIFFCAAWLAPLCIISYCYTSILRIVVGKRNISTKNQEQKLSSRHVKEQAKRKAEIKIALLVIIVIALFFISWTPYAIVALLGIFGQKNLITPLVSMVPALFCKTAACINPFIYIITHPKFRKEFQKLLFKDKSRRMRGTLRTTGYYTDRTKMHRQSKQLSETDVEVVEMKDIPYHNATKMGNCCVETVSSKVSQREGSQKSQRSVSIKDMEENVISPPSWYSKPQFSKKRSFHRQSTKMSF